MRKIKIFLVLAIVLMGCNKNMDKECNFENSSQLFCHLNYSTADYDFLWDNMYGHSTMAGSLYSPDPDANFFYVEPVFNPSNSNEIAYMRTIWDEFESPDGNELWTFNFCTGEANLIADNFRENLDWGSNGWLLYTGVGQEIFKVKSNGDSLTSIVSDGIAGKWNPSGTMFWANIDGVGYRLKDSDGNTIFNDESIPFQPIEWMSDSTILRFGVDAHLQSYNIETNETTTISNRWTCQSCYKIYDNDENASYVLKYNGLNALLKYSFNGDNAIDTIRNLKRSYNYFHGDYLNGKVLTGLRRQRWKDTLTDHRYLRLNIIIMNADGTDERLVELPE